ncbi:beta-1,4-galactosyltransferase 1 isoform X1 [Onthophagus taurus]|uniref:beta-1,4-galactosyltransferase 1 isoform X1 n=2 Tax=Onthophagus taurus TaxID=166361 RepID=UPI0039BE8889
MIRISSLNLNIWKIVLCFSALWFYSPGRHPRHYNYVQNKDVLSELVLPNHENNGHNLNLSVFDRLIINNKVVSSKEIFELKNFQNVDIGGEFRPKKCSSLSKTALIVPYRNRPQQLKIFLNYMHYFMQEQCITYRIFIVDQLDSKPFNRAKLLNIGAVEAMKLNFSCLILHDVDLLPISTGNLYTCTRKPRHMSSSLDVFRYHLTYPDLFGGVVGILTDQFKKINGMSNLFDGWGGEDDDFHARLIKFDLVPYRFSPILSRYIMLKHPKAEPSKERFNMLKDSVDRQPIDGLNSLISNYVIEQKQLYTHIQVNDD